MELGTFASYDLFPQKFKKERAMKKIGAHVRTHAAWAVVCVGVLAVAGVALSTKSGAPLTRETFVNVAQETLPAVVSITVSAVYEPRELRARFRGQRELPEEFRQFPEFREFWEYFRPQMPEIPDDLGKEDEE